MVTVLRTGSDKFGQVWTSQNTCEALFFLNRELHNVQIWPTPQTCVQFFNRTSVETLPPSEVVETALRHTSIGVRCELVWSATFLRSTSESDVSLESSRLGESECEIHQHRTSDKKVIAFDNSCTKAVLSASPGPTTKRCEPQLFLASLGQVIRCSKALDLGSLNMQFQHDWPKDKKLQLFYFFGLKT